MTNKKIYDAFLGASHELKHFFHGHTFTGNPLVCATALANLSLYKRYNLISKVRKRSDQLKSRIREISKLRLVGNVRHKGMLMGIELVRNKKNKIPFSPEKRVGDLIFHEASKHGIYLRSLGQIVMIVPPLAISEKELDFLIDGTVETIKKVSDKVM